MRKQPRQQRSRDMVALLLDAAEQEITTRGLASTTTNHVAARAGVSIGSLYQYFRDQQALVDALLQRDAGRLIAALDERLRSLSETTDPRLLVRAVLEAVFDSVDRSPAQRELLRNWHTLRSHAAFAALEGHVTEICRRYLIRHHHEYRVDNLTVALFVGINSVQYTVAHYLSLDDPPLSRDEVITGLVDMLTAYLLSSRRT
jgi:AcrR family transcriptional regulator